VGKSSIINSIIGYDRLITSNIPGTTRDTTDTFHKFNARNICFIDTAGIRRKKAVKLMLEKICVIMAMKSIKRSQVAALILDATEAGTDQDLKIGAMTHDEGKSVIIVLNKWDLIEKNKNAQKKVIEDVKYRFRFLDYAPVITTSAIENRGFNKFLHTAFNVWDETNRVIETPKLNRVLQAIVQKHYPPVHRGKEIKFYYVTQKGVSPPSFIIFSNYPEFIEEGYKRYLVNSIRKAFGFTGTPLRINFRKRSK